MDLGASSISLRQTYHCMAMFSVIHMNEFQVPNRISVTYNLYQNDFFPVCILQSKILGKLQPKQPFTTEILRQGEWICSKQYTLVTFFEHAKIFSIWARVWIDQENKLFIKSVEFYKLYKGWNRKLCIIGSDFATLSEMRKVHTEVVDDGPGLFQSVTTFGWCELCNACIWALETNNLCFPYYAFSCP